MKLKLLLFVGLSSFCGAITAPTLPLLGVNTNPSTYTGQTIYTLVDNANVPSGLVVTSLSQGAAVVGDGITDNTAVIQKAINTVSTMGGGIVTLPPGIFVTGKLILQSSVTITGSGIYLTILKLKNGTNDDMFQTAAAGYSNGVIVNIAATSGTGSTTGTNWWGISKLSMDGNQLNQTGTSYGFRGYGYGWTLEDVAIRNFLNDGFYPDWNNLTAPGAYQARIHNVSVSNNSGVGFRMAGPSDMMLSNVETFQNKSHGIHIGPNAGGMLISNFHSWGAVPGNRAVSMLIESGSIDCENCVVEGSDTGNVIWLGTEGTFSGGKVFGIAGALTLQTTGFAIGQVAGNTALPGQVYQSGGLTLGVGTLGININWPVMENCNPAFAYTVNEGSNTANAYIIQSAGNYIGGTPSLIDNYNFMAQGLTCDGSLAKCGGVQNYSKAIAGLAFTDGSATNVNFNSLSVPHTWSFAQGVNMDFFADGFSTKVASINGTTGSIRPGPKAAAAIRALTPVSFGEIISCSDCATVPVCVSTGTAVNQWAIITNKASACQ